METTDSAFNGSLDNKVLRQFLETMEPHPELSGLIGEYDRLAIAFDRASETRRSEIEALISKLDVDAVHAAPEGRTSIFARRAALVAELDSLPAQAQEAARAKTIAFLAALRLLPAVADAEIDRLSEAIEAVDAALVTQKAEHEDAKAKLERFGNQYQIDRETARRADVEASTKRRKELDAQLKVAKQVAKQVEPVAQARYPKVKELSLGNEESWQEAAALEQASVIALEPAA